MGMNLSKPGSLVIVLGHERCADCGTDLENGEAVAGEIIGSRQYLVCRECSSEGTSAHLFVVEPDPCDDRVPSWQEAS